MFPRKRGYIFICEDIEQKALELQSYYAPRRVVSFVREKFLTEDAKNVIAEAYKSELDTKYILLGGYEMNQYAQNALLKVLEEPPKNIVFILLSPSKSIILPTIRSRLPIEQEKTQKERMGLEIVCSKMELRDIFAFIQEHKNLPKQEAKKLVEELFEKLISEGATPSKKLLEQFELSYKLLELNTRFSYVLSLLLMGIYHENTQPK